MRAWVSYTITGPSAGVTASGTRGQRVVGMGTCVSTLTRWPLSPAEVGAVRDRVAAWAWEAAPLRVEVLALTPLGPVDHDPYKAFAVLRIEAPEALTQPEPPASREPGTPLIEDFDGD